jgi:hypothetical protein
MTVYFSTICTDARLSDKLRGFTLQPMTVPTQNAAIPQPSVVNHQTKLDDIMSKYAGSGIAQAISLLDLVRKMHAGSGLEVL